MMRFIAFAVLVAAGYGGNALANSSRSTWDSPPQQAVFTYLGHPLTCLVSEDGAQAGNIGGLTCDFVRYWRARR